MARNNTTHNPNWGGKRIGAGRKAGSFETNGTKLRKAKERLSDYFTPAQKIRFVELGMRKAEDNNELLKFFLEQLFGKARQAVELANEDGKALIVQISEAIAVKNGLKHD